MTVTLRYAALSDRGLIRSGNQDSVYAGPRLLAVADGMGGMAAGDVASNIVIATMAPLDEDVPGSALIDTLRGAVEQSNQQMRDAVEANPAMEGMGTTLTGMLFAGSKIGLVHIGDSRAYALRDGEFHQITKDDTYVQMLVDEGRISLEEASSHPQRSLLTRALDGRDADPEYSIRQAIAGDRYLLCSDGLSGVVSAETIDSTLREYTDPQECADRLIQLALRGGGPDNITVIVADVTDEDIVEAQPVVGGAAAQDRGMVPSNHESTPAARASALAGPRPESPGSAGAGAGGAGGDSRDSDDERPRRHPVRTALLLVVLLTLFSGGLWAGWQYTQSHYYVGVTDDGHVAVFQGVNSQIAGLRLYSVRERSATPIADLTDSAEKEVRDGIRADNEADARRRMAQITRDAADNSNLKPQCTPAPSASASSSPSASTDASPGQSGAATPAGSPAPASAPGSGPSVPAGGASASGSPSVSASQTASPTPNTTSQCRPVR